MTADQSRCAHALMPCLPEPSVDAQLLHQSTDVCAVATMPVQLLYVTVTSTFPFNSLLSGLAGSAGFAVLTCAHNCIADYSARIQMQEDHAFGSVQAGKDVHSEPCILSVTSALHACSVSTDAGNDGHAAFEGASATEGACGICICNVLFVAVGLELHGVSGARARPSGFRPVTAAGQQTGLVAPDRQQGCRCHLQA